MSGRWYVTQEQVDQVMFEIKHGFELSIIGNSEKSLEMFGEALRLIQEMIVEEEGRGQ